MERPQFDPIQKAEIEYINREFCKADIRRIDDSDFKTFDKRNFGRISKQEFLIRRAFFYFMANFYPNRWYVFISTKKKGLMKNRLKLLKSLYLL